MRQRLTSYGVGGKSLTEEYLDRRCVTDWLPCPLARAGSLGVRRHSKRAHETKGSFDVTVELAVINGF